MRGRKYWQILGLTLEDGGEVIVEQIGDLLRLTVRSFERCDARIDRVALSHVREEALWILVECQTTLERNNGCTGSRCQLLNSSSISPNLRS